MGILINQLLRKYWFYDTRKFSAYKQSHCPKRILQSKDLAQVKRSVLGRSWYSIYLLFRRGASLLSTFHRNYTHRKTLSITASVKCYFFAFKNLSYIFIISITDTCLLFFLWRTLFTVFHFPLLTDKVLRGFSFLRVQRIFCSKFGGFSWQEMSLILCRGEI